MFFKSLSLHQEAEIDLNVPNPVMKFNLLHNLL